MNELTLTTFSVIISTREIIIVFSNRNDHHVTTLVRLMKQKTIPCSKASPQIESSTTDI